MKGDAGFVGVNHVPGLLGEGFKVVVFDNMSRGSLQNFDEVSHPGFVVQNVDLVDSRACGKAFADVAQMGLIAEVWNLAAN